MQYRIIAFCAVLSALVCSLSCDTINVGTTGGPRPPMVFVTVTIPANMTGTLEASWTVSWTGGVAPYTIEMNMGGGTTENVPAGTAATSPFTQVFTMVNEGFTAAAHYTYNIRVTDSLGSFGYSTGTYSVSGPPQRYPEIVSAVYTESTRTLVVTVRDEDNDEALYVSVTEPAGMNVDALVKTASQTGPLTASFVFRAEDPLTGATGSTDVTVTDFNAESNPTTVAITIPALVLAADTLYAIPIEQTVAISEPVTVIVATGVPANPFQYVNGVGLTIESDADKVPNSFNAGAVGGSDEAIDGFWTVMAPDWFLMPPDGFIQAFNISGGRERWDFNLTPTGGSDQTSASGALFNFQFTFGLAGTKTFGFQAVDGSINRTYYSDSASNEYFWGDITNSAAPAVTVTE